MSLESDKRPHISKTISYGTIIVLAVMVVTQLIVYGADQEKQKSITEKVLAMDAKHLAMIQKELKSRDIQIKNLSNQLQEVKTEVKSDVKDNQKLIIEVLKRLPPQ